MLQPANTKEEAVESGAMQFKEYYTFSFQSIYTNDWLTELRESIKEIIHAKEKSKQEKFF